MLLSSIIAGREINHGKVVSRVAAAQRIKDLTNRWSQPLAAVKSTFDFMKPFSVFAALAPASGGSALSR